MNDLKFDDSDENLSVSMNENIRGDQKRKKFKSKSRSKYKDFKLKWFTYHKIDHFKKAWPKRRNKSDYIRIVVISNEDCHKSVGALVVTNLNSKKS